ncbi:FkbM family methyltransferase [Chelativorans sp. M5D2P16]|uniref:FkbM family methyltransferase n=1 Tax=Chelativorans sp. M5D2P16 TaxID=3095678 RepID=UPI002ACA9AB0|nr:FkbM family methyltransferase [Chelativorans sp. M5D2P16]MDZ5697635.1 FkbM family methyltransferase [Chelativorans sp. M5D2P16]
MRAEFEEYVVKGRQMYGMSFDFLITDPVAEDWYGPENQEMIERRWCVDNIKPGMVAADCGAHHGIMTLLFSKLVGPDGFVYSYEILPDNAEIVRRNVELNRLVNVEVFPYGIGDTVMNTLALSHHGNGVASSSGDVSVSIVPLDLQFGRKRQVHFLKIDVEGSELAALRGARETIKEHRPLIDLEVHNFLFKDPRSVLVGIFEFLAEGWAIEVSDNQNPTEPIDWKADLDRLSAMFNPHIFFKPI